MDPAARPSPIPKAESHELKYLYTHPVITSKPKTTSPIVVDAVRFGDAFSSFSYKTGNIPI